MMRMTMTNTTSRSSHENDNNDGCHSTTTPTTATDDDPLLPAPSGSRIIIPSPAHHRPSTSHKSSNNEKRQHPKQHPKHHRRRNNKVLWYTAVAVLVLTHNGYAVWTYYHQYREDGWNGLLLSADRREADDREAGRDLHDGWFPRPPDVFSGDTADAKSRESGRETKKKNGRNDKNKNKKKKPKPPEFFRLATWFDKYDAPGNQQQTWLPMCRWIQMACRIRHRKYPLAAGAQMRREGVWELGGAVVSGYVVVLAVLGLLMEYGWWCHDHQRTNDKTRPEENDHESLELPPRETQGNNALENGNNKNQHDYQISSSSSLSFSSASLSTIWQTMKRNAQIYWFGPSSSKMNQNNRNSFTFTQPALTFKLFLAALLIFELNHGSAPETGVLVTPETIQLYRRKPSVAKFVPHWINNVLLWDLEPETADRWVARMHDIRGWLIVSWCAYLLVPSATTTRFRTTKRTNTLSLLLLLARALTYTVGALAYGYLGTIGLSYNISHSVQGAIIFIVAAIPAVPFLTVTTTTTTVSTRTAIHPPNDNKFNDETSNNSHYVYYAPQCSGQWLRRFLYLAVLIPIYLFSGICKFRYKGVWSNITGDWIHHTFNARDEESTSLLTLYRFMGNDTAWASIAAQAIMSWANVFIEWTLPLAAVIWMEHGLVRFVFHVSSVLFHMSILFLLGPNFTRYCLMHFFASDPLGWMPGCFQYCAGVMNKVSRKVFHDTLTTGFRFPGMYCKRIKSYIGVDKDSRPSFDDGEDNGRNGDSQETFEEDSSRHHLRLFRWRDVACAIVAGYSLFSWFWVQLRSDVEHLLGTVDRLEQRNPFIIFPELAMYAAPTVGANYTVSLVMVLLSIAIYLDAMLWNAMISKTVLAYCTPRRLMEAIPSFV